MPSRPERRELVADVGLEHLGPVGADRVADAVAVELVEDPAELVPARHDAGVEVRGGADLEHDPTLAEHRHGPRVVSRLHAVADPVGLEQLDDPRDLLDRPGLAGMDRDPEPELSRAAQQASVVGDPERRGLGARDVDADDAAVAPQDRLLHDDLVELVREGAVEAEDQARFHRVLERRAVHAPHRRRDDVVEVLLATAVALHRVEAQLHGRDVVLAVRAADDLVHRALDGDRARLDELGPVEQLQVAVEGLGTPRVDRDQVTEVPVVAGGELDALGVGDRPHDRRGDRRAEVAMELRERDLATQGLRHRHQSSRGRGAGDPIRRPAPRGHQRRASPGGAGP